MMTVRRRPCRRRVGPNRVCAPSLLGEEVLLRRRLQRHRHAPAGFVGDDLGPGWTLSCCYEVTEPTAVRPRMPLMVARVALMMIAVPQERRAGPERSASGLTP